MAATEDHMAGRAGTLRFGAVVFLLLLSFSVCGTEARASKAMKYWAGPWGGTNARSLDRLALRTVKHSGPSPGGPGHRSRNNGRLVVPIKDSVARLP